MIAKEKRAANTSSKATKVVANNGISDEERISQIEVIAYYKAESRGFEPGHELEDWVLAETEFLS